MYIPYEACECNSFDMHEYFCERDASYKDTLQIAKVKKGCTAYSDDLIQPGK